MEHNSTQKQLNNSVKQVNKNGDTRGLHPNSLKNLKPRWQPGQSGNPRGQSITARQQQMMPEVCPFDAKGRIWLDALAEGGMRMALTQSSALNNLQDRHEGKVVQPIGGEDGQPIKTEIIVSNETAKKLTQAILSGEGT